MFRESILVYFYNNICMTRLSSSFNDVCYWIKANFKDLEFQRDVKFEWDSLFLKSIMNINIEKSTQTCLDKLLEKLRHWQHSLTFELWTKHYIHDKLLNACRDIKTYSYIYYISTSIMTSLIDNLRSSIMIYQIANFFNLLKTFFTNRKYHKFSFKQINSRSPSSTSYEKNKCFVCLKEECWSFNHIREKRMTFKKKFKNRFEQRFDKKSLSILSISKKSTIQIMKNMTIMRLIK